MADYNREDHGEGCACSRCYLAPVEPKAAPTVTEAALALINAYGGDVPPWLQSEVAALVEAIDREAKAPSDSDRCDFCGMEAGVSRLRGLPRCAPPFEVQVHQWTGKHPSHQMRERCAKEGARLRRKAREKSK
jgi:hypothetical protein